MTKPTFEIMDPEGPAGMPPPSTPEATAREIAFEWVRHDYDCPLAHDENGFYEASSCNCGRINELAVVIAAALAAAEARGPAPQAEPPRWCRWCKHSKEAHTSDLGCCVMPDCPCVRFELPEPSRTRGRAAQEGESKMPPYTLTITQTTAPLEPTRSPSRIYAAGRAAGLREAAIVQAAQAWRDAKVEYALADSGTDPDWLDDALTAFRAAEANLIRALAAEADTQEPR